MLIAEMLLLVAVDDKGHVPAGSDAFVKIGLTGALLAELAIGGQLIISEDGTVRTADTRPGDELLTDVYDAVRNHLEGRKAKQVIRALSGHIGGSRDRVVGRLADTGVLGRNKPSVLRPTRHPVLDTAARQAVLDQVQAAARGEGPVKRRELLTGLAAAALAGGCASQAPGWVRASQARNGRPVALPPPAATGTSSLEQAVGRRRSRRAFRLDPLPVATIGQLLWAGQGTTGPDGKRAAPSAGALYPLELYALTPEQVMHYLPEGHRAETRAVPDLRTGLTAAAFGQPHVGAAPAIIVMAAVPARIQREYGIRAEAFAQLEAGHAAQNILLQAAARGLAAVPVGSLEPARAAVTLALPPGQTVPYLIPLARRACCLIPGPGRGVHCPAAARGAGS